jgi:amidase
MGSMTTDQTGSIPDWQVKANKKWQEAQDLIPKEWRLPQHVLDFLKLPFEKNPNRLIELDVVRKSKLLTDQELSITEDFTIAQLLAQLANGHCTAVEVTTAFSKRAAIAQQLTFCLTETFFDQALERARFLDQSKKDGKPLGPLHGLPISLKDGFNIKGIESTIGFVSFLGKKATTNAPLVEILLQAGAVLYVKTNIPMTLMTGDSHNNIFQRALNPHKTTLNAGGSSGGEGALVGFRGSPLGVGTDVAGSVRIPSLCCGVYGFKPTSSRIPYGGQAIPGLAGWKPITACAGPFANDFDALEIFSKVVIDSVPANFDSTAIDVPWRQVAASDAKLKIGVLAEDPKYPLHPPVKRALSEAVQRLEAAGHQIVRLTAEQGRVAETCEIADQLFGLETAATRANIAASGEPAVPSVINRHSPAKGSFVPNMDGMDRLQKFAALSVKRQELAEHWRRIWTEIKVDAIISSAAQCTAVQHDQFPWPAYTCHLNVHDVSSSRLAWVRS